MPGKPRKYKPPGTPTRSQQHRQYDSRRGSSAQRLYGYRWQKASKAFLAEHPLCRHCDNQGRTTPAKVVDHIISHNGDTTLFWDRDNWQPLCTMHHNRKTRQEQHATDRQHRSR